MIDAPARNAESATQTHLVVLARKAELGKGKTRLAKTVGEARALSIYRELIAVCASCIRNSGLRATVYFKPEVGDHEVWWGPVLAKAVQPDKSDFGDRIFTCAEQAATRNPDSNLIIIGADCPYLAAPLLWEAERLLETHDAVLGPSTDGGYYLIGFSQNHPSIFDLSAWSKPSVAEETRDRIRVLGWSLAELPELSDIDTEKDYLDYREWLSSTNS